MFVFPKWTNRIKYAAGAVLLIAPVYVVALVWYGASPATTNTGYAPDQPIPYSHELHAGQLEIDCRYCHTAVFDGASATIPSTEICMNCHAAVRPESPNLTLLMESYKSGRPVEWIRVHDLPDYVYFDHSAHVNRGVGCATCHGRIDTMEVVTQVETLSMGWCLECHRQPEDHLRPMDYIADMTWSSPDQKEEGRQLKEEYNISTSTDCSTCHR